MRGWPTHSRRILPGSRDGRYRSRGNLRIQEGLGDRFGAVCTGWVGFSPLFRGFLLYSLLLPGILDILTGCRVVKLLELAWGSLPNPNSWDRVVATG